MARVNIGNIPPLGQPEPVTRAVEEAAQLRDRLRAAREQAAAAQTQLDELEREDVQRAAAKARSGATSLGAPLPALAKARTGLEDARRAEAALSLAAEGAAGDLASAIVANSAAWIAACDDTQAKAREAARRELDELSASIQRLRSAAATSAWVRTAVADGRYDRPAPAMRLGSGAPTSAKMTANSAPLTADQVLAFARELLGETEAVGARGAEPDRAAASRASAAVS